MLCDVVIMIGPSGISTIFLFVVGLLVRAQCQQISVARQMCANIVQTCYAESLSRLEVATVALPDRSGQTQCVIK